MENDVNYFQSKKIEETIENISLYTNKLFDEILAINPEYDDIIKEFVRKSEKLIDTVTSLTEITTELRTKEIGYILEI